MYLLKQKPRLLVMHIHINIQNLNCITNNLKQGWLNAAYKTCWVMYYVIYFLMKNLISQNNKNSIAYLIAPFIRFQ